VTAGIQITSDNCVVRNCFVGTTPDGKADGGSQGIGILVRGSNNRIGGPNANDRNVVSGNGSGVVISGFTGGGNGNLILNNIIGLDVTGAVAIPNSTGIFLSATAQNSQISGNVISGNGSSGIRIISPNASGNVVRGNRIGVAADGVTGRGNGSQGVLIAGGAHNNVIGGSAAADGNIIAFNGQKGVVVGDISTGVFGLAGVGNSVLSNLFFSEPFFIDLGPSDGVTPNDSLDGDTGPNNLQNSIFLTGAGNSAGATVVQGTLNSTPSSTFTIQLFVTTQLDANGRPLNLALLASGNAVSDNLGNFAFTINCPLQAVGNIILATATNFNTGDTSEFFNQVVVANTPPMILNDVLTPDIFEGGNATLSGNLVDPDPGDKLGLTINWGDGSPVKTYYPGLDPFAFQHRYDDDGIYNVSFTWFDNHGGSRNRTRQVTVHNVTPQLLDLSVQSDEPNLHQQIVLSGRIVDPGDDTFTMTVAWGDGSSETIAREHDGEFRLQHRYQHAGQFTIQLTLTDDDGGMTSRMLTIDVG
jgi:PKD domain-containing protein